MAVLTEIGLYKRLWADARLAPGPDFDRVLRGRLRYVPDIGFFVKGYPVEDGDHIAFLNRSHGRNTEERTVKFRNEGLIDGLRV